MKSRLIFCFVSFICVLFCLNERFLFVFKFVFSFFVWGGGLGISVLFFVSGNGFVYVLSCCVCYTGFGKVQRQHQLHPHSSLFQPFSYALLADTLLPAQLM